MPDINILWHEGGLPPWGVLFTLKATRAYVNFFSAIQSASEIWKWDRCRFMAAKSN